MACFTHKQTLHENGVVDAVGHICGRKYHFHMNDGKSRATTILEMFRLEKERAKTLHYLIEELNSTMS